jgi:hypothetical protein
MKAHEDESLGNEVRQLQNKYARAWPPVISGKDS